MTAFRMCAVASTDGQFGTPITTSAASAGVDTAIAAAITAPRSLVEYFIGFSSR
jgi:hypothetical protein